MTVIDNDLLEQALKEAYATAPQEIVLLNTLEFNHSLFVDEDDNTISIRVVNNPDDLELPLESEANGLFNTIDTSDSLYYPNYPYDQNVTFTSFPFNVTLPSVDDKQSSTFGIQVDGITPYFLLLIDKIKESNEKIRITFREYQYNTETAIDEKRFVLGMKKPYNFVATTASVQKTSIAFSCFYDTLLENRFSLDKRYTLYEFPGLVT